MSSYYSSPSRSSGATANTSLLASTSSLNSPSTTSSSAASASTSGSALSTRFGSTASASSAASASSSTRTPMRKTRTIVVLGSSMVGKTAICVRFVNDRFDEAYEPTYENSFLKVIRHRGTEIECIIKDSQGIGENEVFRNEYGLGVHGYVLVYSITSLRSFEIVKNINNKLINLIGSRNVPRILIGNKSDQHSSGSSTGSSSELRQVTTEMGQQLANQWNCAFIECSCKQNLNITRAFDILLDEIDKSNEPERPSLFSTSGLERIFSGDCFGCCRRENDESLESPSLAVINQRIEKYTFWSKLTCWLTMLMSLTGIGFAVWIGFFHNDSENELISYCLFGFSFLIWLVSLVGLYGLRVSSAEFLKVYAVSLLILIVCEISVWILLFINIATFSDHVVVFSIGGALGTIIQISAGISGQRLVQAMNANNIGSPYTADFQHSSYHSLYE